MIKVTIAEASEMLGVSKRMTRALCEAGIIGVVKHGNRNTYIVWREWVEGFMAKGGTK